MSAARKATPATATGGMLGAPPTAAQPNPAAGGSLEHVQSNFERRQVPAPERLMTAEQVAERWQVPRAHVYRLAREGRLPVVMLGRYRRFRVDEIERFERAGGAAANV